MLALRAVSIALLIWALGACSTNPAPVIDRLPSKSNSASKPAPTSKPNIKTGNKVNGDWRPDTYTVKKGDTLFSIGLEHGYDYKDIAQANDIKAPYTIKIGQTLKLSALKEKPAIAENKPVQENTDSVTTYPINNDSSPANTNDTQSPPQVIALSEPKAVREPYSEEAFKKPLPPATKIDVPKQTPAKASKPADDAKPETIKSDTAKPEIKAEAKTDSKTNSETADDFDWVWPTKGKVIANFNDAGNKGIDITGNMGQAIVATAPGKVIYSGSDLRGYGKLVIVKHNATYLSVYAHNSQILVKEGQQVSRGQKIAEMGNTDSSTVKLHFEIRQQGKSIDPAKFLASN